MWLTSTSLRRPVFIVMFVLALVVMGYRSRSGMPKELNPNMEAPFITIITTYSGAGPSEIETLVTEPIEKAVSSIANLKDVTSTSQQGTSTVMVEFEFGTDIEAAAGDVRDKVSATRASLPDDAGDPQVLKMDTTSMPVMTVALAGSLTAKEMRLLADNTISDRLAKIGGVASVNVSGGEEREIQVAVDKTRLDAYGLGIGSVVSAINTANVNTPAGSIKEGTRDYTIRTVGEFTRAQEIAEVPIPLAGSTDRATQVVRVSDIAQIKDTVAEPDEIVRLNGQPSVILSIQKQSGANTVAIADGIKRELTALRATLPGGVHPVIATDQSVYVEEALEAVNSSLLEGVLLVVVIVFLFLHSVRATFIVGLAIPTSLMATYLPIGALGFTQNQMVLLALSLVVGILVDDSIVVLENIERHLRLRKRPEVAALDGRSEIGLAAITITMVDIVVFLPIAFMGGMVGQVFRQFGITVACATAFSLLMSFTLTPMLASRWMRSEEDKARGEAAIAVRTGGGHRSVKDRLDLLAERLFAALERGMRGLDQYYRSLLEWSLHNRCLTIVIGVMSLLVVFAMVMPRSGQGAGLRLVIALIALLGAVVAAIANRGSKGLAVIFGAAMAVIALTVYLPFGFEFFAQTDESQFTVTVRMPSGTSLSATDRVVQQVESIIDRLPEMKTVSYRVSDASPLNPLSWFRRHAESQTGYCIATVGSASQGGMQGSGDSGGQYATVSVKVVDRQHRARSLQGILDWVSAQTAHLPGAELIGVAASSGSSPTVGIEKEVLGQNIDDCVEQANRVAEVMRNTAGVANVDISYKPNTPERRVIVDKYRASKLGLTESEVATAVRTALDGDDSAQLREGGTEYPIRVQYARSQRSAAADVGPLVIGARNGAPIHVSDVAEVTYAFSPNKIERENRQKVVTISADIAGGYQMGNVNQSIEQALRSTPVLAGTTVKSGGSTEMMSEALISMISALGLAVLLVYMLMGALFESFLTPFVIMFSLPQAMVGALLAMLVTGKSMGITAMIGVIMLMGLVSKNAILLLDYTNTLMSRGKSRDEALLEAGPTRLRPILMTTCAMVGGMLPTALALSQGSESRSPMAVAVIGGLLFSTLLTLVVIPVVFTLVDDAWKAFLHRFFPRAYARALARQGTATTEPAPAES